MNNVPATKGIHHSLMPKLIITHLPAVFANPEAKMKLVASTAPIISVTFLPSKKPKTNPHTIAKGKPLMNRKIKLYGAGTSANKNKDTHAIKMSLIIVLARLDGFNEAIKRMP